MVRHAGAYPPNIASQKGVVLIVALVILMAMTIISISSMSTSTLEEKMSSNLKDREIAFQAAEAGLRRGESLVQAGIDSGNFTTSCTDGYCQHDLHAGKTYPEYWTDATLDVWNDSNKHIQSNLSGSGILGGYKIIIEYMGGQIQDFSAGPQPNDPTVYRITALGTGLSTNSRVMLQSTYIKN